MSVTMNTRIEIKITIKGTIWSRPANKRMEVIVSCLSDSELEVPDSTKNYDGRIRHPDNGQWFDKS